MISNPSITEAITSEDVLGKDVIDANGVFLGVTDKLYLHPKTLRVTGISVDKGFLRKGFIIGSSYIKAIAPHAVFLSIEPAFRIRGMTVFDKDGAKVGVVRAVSLAGDSNEIAELEVRTGRFRRKTILVPREAVDRIETNVLLSVSRSDLLASQSQ